MPRRSRSRAVPQLTVPLVVALEYDERHRDELERTGDAELILRRWLAELA